MAVAIGLIIAAAIISDGLSKIADAIHGFKWVLTDRQVAGSVAET